jgi:hypothetical protein
VTEPLSNELLLNLYKISIEEYRFQVKLNWDRTAYHLTLNSGLVAVAAGLLKVGAAPVVDLFVAGLFFIGLLVSLIGIKNTRTGHEYYRRTVLKKTLIEDQIGLTRPLDQYRGRPTLSVGTTLGQNEHLKILSDPEKWLKRRPRFRSITSWTTWILALFLLANIGGIVGCVWLYRHPSSAVTSSVKPCP